MNKSDKALKKRIYSLARDKKLHQKIQSKLKKIVSKRLPTGLPVSELSQNSYNYDFYALIGNVKVHIEIIYSLSVVDRDINMLKSSDADLKIALIKDEFLDGGAVIKKYFRELDSRDIPHEQFTTYPLSRMFRGTQKLLRDLTKKIEEKSTIKGIGKTYEQITNTLTELGKSEDIDAFFELMANNLVPKDVLGVSDFAKNLNKIESEIRDTLKNLPNISSEKLCTMNIILRKYKASKVHNKLLTLPIDDHINIEDLITFFKDKAEKKESLKDTDFKQLFDLYAIIHLTTIFSKSDLNFVSTYQKFSSTIYNNYAQNIAKEPFTLIKCFGTKKFIEIGWGDEYGYENILRVLYFYKTILGYRELLFNKKLPERTYLSGKYLRQSSEYVIRTNKYYDTKTRVFASAGLNFKDLKNLNDNKVYMWNLSNTKIPEAIFSGSELSLNKILVKNIRGTYYLIASGEDNCIYVWDVKFPPHPTKMFIDNKEKNVELIDIVDLDNKPTIIGKSGNFILYWDFFGKACPIKEQVLEGISIPHDFKTITNRLLYCSKTNFNLKFGDVFSAEKKELELSQKIDTAALKWLGINAAKLADNNGKLLILLGGQFRGIYLVDTAKMKLMPKVFEQRDENEVITDILLEMLNGEYYLIASTLKHRILIWNFEKTEKYPSEIECGEDDLYELGSQKINGRDYIFVSGIDGVVYMIDPFKKRVVEKFEGAKSMITSIAIEKID